MSRKKSVKRSAGDFKTHADEVSAFVTAATPHLSAQHVSWIHEQGILRLYREFESLILDALVGAVNNDTTTIASRTGIEFPKHLTDEVCEYLIVGDGYFDVKGRDGLIKTLKSFVPDTHYLVTIIKKDKYKSALEQLSALRNFAAHNSSISKSRAKEAVGQERMPDAGAWLKKQNRLMKIIDSLKTLSDEIHAAAPF